MGLPISSPDITNLDFLITYDLSGATPAITLTNNSTVVHPLLLSWWYVITTPSGMIIHQGSSTTPDVNNVAWTTLSITPNSWPTPFGSGICDQVEFSCAAPYVCTLYVKDSTNTTYQLAKQVVICRPAGNTVNGCGNFGVANLSVAVQCSNARLLCSDSTNYSYGGNIQPTGTPVNTWTLVYPQSPAGGLQPANGTASNSAYVWFPLAYSATGFNLYLNNYATYNMGNGQTIILQYKAQSTFNVYCNVDVCQLLCEMAKFQAMATAKCGDLIDPDLNNKMTMLNWMISQVALGIMQPSCNIDVPGLIQQIETMFGFESCACGSSLGINQTSAASGNSGLTTTSNVINIATGLAPATCPNSFFPAQIYDPTGLIIIGVASSADDMVSILNANAAWQAYGTALNTGNCTVEWITTVLGETVPVIKVAINGTTTTCTNGTQSYLAKMVDLCASSTTITASSYPLNLYVDFGLGAGPVFAGNVATQAAAVIALNAVASKPVSVTFSAGGTVATFNVANSNCTAYSATINITCDAGSANFLLYGGSSVLSINSDAPIFAGESGYGLRTDLKIGAIPGESAATALWHTILIGTTLINAEGNTGKVNFWDVSTPLQPKLIRTIQLTAPSGASGNFTGSPLSASLSTGATGNVGTSWYSLYFPSEYSNMTLSAVYIFEAITGSAWQLNMFDYSSTNGITASFYDQRLKGKCPRIMQKGTIYFTQDGDLETSSGISSGIAVGSTIALSLGTFSSGGISTIASVISGGTEYVWTASFDGVNTIWFGGNLGTIVQFSISSNSVTNTYPFGMGSNGSTHRTLRRRGNSIFYLGNLIVTNLGNFLIGVDIPAISINVASLATTPVVIPFQGSPTGTYTLGFSGMPTALGNCLLLIPSIGGTTETTGGLPAAIGVYNLSGTLLQHIPITADGIHTPSVYNVVAIPNISTYTPTTLV